MSNDAAAFVGNAPQVYDRDVGPVLFVDYAEDLARRVAVLSPKRVLETAAGTGIVTRRLYNILPPGAHVTATDLNPPMLALARSKFAPGDAVTFQEADATALPFPDGSFDAVVCQFGVMFFPDKAKSYAEAHRVLAPGCSYLFNVWDSLNHNPPARISHELLTALFRNDPPDIYRVAFTYHSIDAIKDALTAAGFVDLRVSVTGRVKEVADIGRFARAVVYGNPAADQIKARGGDPEAMVAALNGAYRREFGENPSRIPIQAILFEALRP